MNHANIIDELAESFGIRPMAEQVRDFIYEIRSDNIKMRTLLNDTCDLLQKMLRDNDNDPANSINFGPDNYANIGSLVDRIRLFMARE